MITTWFSPYRHRNAMKACSNFLTLFVLLLPMVALADANKEPGPEASVTITNRSGYHMLFASWKNGKDCSNKIILDPGFNLNSAQAQTIAVPAEKLIAFGVSIVEVQDKLPVVCDYILSFKLSPATKYTIDYDVHDRRCFGQLYELKNDAYQMVVPGDKEDLTERMPEFGWDQFEPGCAEI